MTLKTCLGASVAAIALMLSGCGGGDAMEIAPVEQSELIDSIEGFQVDAIDLSTSKEALEYMGLTEEGQYAWDKKTVSGDQVVITNLILPDEGGKIDRLELSGAHLENGNPLFQSIEVQGLVYNNVLGKPVTTIERGRLNISGELKEDIVSNIGFLEVDSLFDGMNYLGWETLASGGGYMQGLTFSNRRISMEVGFLGWAPEEEDNHVSFLIDDLAIKPQWRYEATNALVMTLDHASAAGYDTIGMDSREYSDYNIYNVFDQGYESLIVENLDVSVDSFKMNLPSFRAGLAGDRDGKYTNETDMPVMTLGFDDEPFAGQLMSLWQMFDASGLETAELSLKAKVNLDAETDHAEMESFDLVMKDAFEVTMDFNVTGYQNFIAELIDYSHLSTDVDGDNFEKWMEQLEVQEEQMKAARSGLDVDFFEGALIDQNGLEKVLASMAETQDVSVDVAQQQAKAYAMMMTLGLDNDFQTEIATDFATNAQSFLTEGGQLKFSVRPDEDFSLGVAMEQYERFTTTDSDYARIIEEKSRLKQSGIEDLDSKEPESIKDIFGPMNIDFEHLGTE